MSNIKLCQSDQVPSNWIKTQSVSSNPSTRERMMVYPEDYLGLALPAMRNTHTSLHARATKLNQVISVEQLPDGCVLIRVEFGRAKRAGSPAPLGEESHQG
jgi:hypothetical protein